MQSKMDGKQVVCGSIYDYDKWEFRVCKSIEELCKQYTEADIEFL